MADIIDINEYIKISGNKNPDIVNKVTIPNESINVSKDLADNFTRFISFKDIYLYMTKLGLVINNIVLATQIVIKERLDRLEYEDGDQVIEIDVLKSYVATTSKNICKKVNDFYGKIRSKNEKSNQLSTTIKQQEEVSDTIIPLFKNEESVEEDTKIDKLVLELQEEQKIQGKETMSDEELEVMFLSIDEINLDPHICQNVDENTDEVINTNKKEKSKLKDYFNWLTDKFKMTYEKEAMLTKEIEARRKVKQRLIKQKQMQGFATNIFLATCSVIMLIASMIFLAMRILK